MDTRNETLSGLARSAADRLSALRSETAVQIHLAGMDAKKAWSALTPELDSIEARLHDAVEAASSGHAAMEVHLALMDAKDRYYRIEPQLRAIVGDARDAAKHALEAMGAALDQVLVQPGSRPARAARRSGADRGPRARSPRARGGPRAARP